MNDNLATSGIRVGGDFKSGFFRNFWEYLTGATFIGLYLAVFVYMLYRDHPIAALIYLGVVTMRSSFKNKNADEVEFAEKCEAAALKRVEALTNCLETLKKEFQAKPVDNITAKWAVNRIDLAVDEAMSIKNPRV